MSLANTTGETFWNFSVRTYRSPGVPDASLSLQNDFGADVNMLLFCCWVGAQFGPFDEELFGRARKISEMWSEHVVIPLRFARTWMKNGGCEADSMATAPCMKLREDIKNVEFAAEELQQNVLASLLTETAARSDGPDNIMQDVVANLRRYLASIDIPAQPDVRAKLSTIVRAAIPALTADRVNLLLEMPNSQGA